MRSPLVSSLKQSAGGEGIIGSSSCKKPMVGLKRGPWTAEEDELLANYVKREGEGKWRMLPKKAGLLRCGKSCRLRWMNYLRPSIKRGRISDDEEDLILRLHRLLGNRWSLIAGRIPGRTDNEIKNYWNTHLSKKLINQGIDPKTHKPLLLNPMINTSNIGNKQSSNPDSSNVSNLSKKSIFVHGDADYCADHKDGTKKDEFRENDDGKSEECEEDDIGSLLMDDGFCSFLNTLINDDNDNDDGIFSESMKQHQEPEEEEK